MAQLRPHTAETGWVDTACRKTKPGGINAISLCCSVLLSATVAAACGLNEGGSTSRNGAQTSNEGGLADEAQGGSGDGAASDTTGGTHGSNSTGAVQPRPAAGSLVPEAVRIGKILAGSERLYWTQPQTYQELTPVGNMDGELWSVVPNEPAVRLREGREFDSPFGENGGLLYLSGDHAYRVAGDQPSTPEDVATRGLFCTFDAQYLWTASAYGVSRTPLDNPVQAEEVITFNLPYDVEGSCNERFFVFAHGDDIYRVALAQGASVEKIGSVEGPPNGAVSAVDETHFYLANGMGVWRGALEGFEGLTRVVSASSPSSPLGSWVLAEGWVYWLEDPGSSGPFLQRRRADGSGEPEQLPLATSSATLHSQLAATKTHLFMAEADELRFIELP